MNRVLSLSDIGTITVKGVWKNSASTIINNGVVDIYEDAESELTDTDVAGNGDWNEGVNSLHFKGTSSITGDATFTHQGVGYS